MCFPWHCSHPGGPPSPAAGPLGAVVSRPRRRRSPSAPRSRSRGRFPPRPRGGPAYRAAILWEQTAGRLVHGVRAPAAVVVVSLCCCRWPSTPGPCGRRCGGRWRAGDAERWTWPGRFAFAWVVPGLIALSVISGKQIHYLIPLLPGFAILAAKALPSDRRQTVIALSLVSPLLVILVETAGKGYLDRSDLRPVSSYLHQAEASGRPIAFKGQYAGTFHFLGRLKHPFAQLSWEQVPQWAREHPTGLLIRSTRSPADTVGAVFHQPLSRGSASASGELQRCHPDSLSP